MFLHNIQIFITIIALSSFLFSCASDTQSELTENKTEEKIIFADSTLTSLPDVIKDLPVGIEVWHEPDTFRAVVWDKDTTRFIWKHQTFLFSFVGDLKIIEFGTCNFKDGEWVLGNITKKEYGEKELCEWYVKYENGMVKWEQPENGVIKKDVVYFDPSNYSIKNKELVQRNGLWYYIGIDSAGKKYMGYGSYIALPELVK